MADRSCPVCGEHTIEGARFCAACGVRLDAPVVLDGDNPSPATSTEHVRSGGRLASVLVPLLVLGVLAAGAFVLLEGGDEANPDASSDDADSQTTPSVDVEPTPTPTAPTPTPTTRPTPRVTPTTPTPADPEARVDVAALASTDATHLAVQKGNQVAFLDLGTGGWVVREVRGQSMSPDTPPWAFGRGIVTNASGAVVYVPIDGEQTTLSQGWAVGATVDRVWINAGGERGVRAVVAINTDGAIVDEFTPPPMTWVESALSTGQLVVRGGGRLFIRSDSDIRPVTDGETYGVVDTRALTQRCDDELACEFSIVDLVTGDATVLDLDLSAGRFPQLVRGGIVVYGGENATFYRIEGSSVTFDRDLSYEEADAVFWAGPTRATDALGVSAVIDGTVLRFEDPRGDTVAEASVDFLAGFGEPSVLFITAADAS